MKLAIALLPITSDFLRDLTEQTRCISPQDVQVSVAGSLGVFQVFAQVIDRLDVAARFALDARVAQVPDQQVQFHPSHPNSTNQLILRPTTKRRLQAASR